VHDTLYGAYFVIGPHNNNIIIIVIYLWVYALWHTHTHDVFVIQLGV
jgi:hypothetical protein